MSSKRRESKALFKERLTREGRFGEAHAWRRKLVTDGICSDSESWERARLEYPPVGSVSAVGSVDGFASLALVALDRKADPRSEVEWVSRNILIPVEKIDPDDVPSSSAVALLRWARKEESEFYRGVYSKIMPKQSEIDREARFKDDGRTTVDIIDQVRRTHPGLAVVPSGSEGVGCEPVVS